ncbi:MAG TPA: hypothetical protein VG013_16290 [Gemmataceae bacterium]|jgi:hypothetical protein|nr:hypothetical protein [Gemmataceae bacterium]
MSKPFRPQIEMLEDRQLLSVAASSVFLPIPMLPRTGGAAFQEGSVLHVVLQNEPANTEATITDDGHGDVTAEWNGKAPHAFQGVRAIVVDSLGQQDVIHYNLTGNVTRHEVVDVRLASPNSQFIPDLGTFRSRGLDIDVEPGADKDGTLFQAGPVLFLALSRPEGSQAVIQDDGHGNITVEWDGHTRTFHGIRQLVIDSLGRQDTISFTLTGNVTRALEVDVQLADPGSTFTPKLGSFRTDGLTFCVETF